MGIRYLAISIDQQDFEHLSVGPCATCGEQPQLRDLDDEEDARRETLDLDKSWGYFQRVLDSDPIRPAASLVRGDVTHSGYGWRSYRGLIAPADVPAIAEDLATVTSELLRERVVLNPRFEDRAQEDFEYVSQFVPEAQKFTKQVADEGRAILYFIG